MSKVPEQYAAEIRANGDNPDDFIWDDASQSAVHITQAPPMTIGESVKQGLRNVTAGFGGGLADTAGFIGRAAEKFAPGQPVAQAVAGMLRKGAKGTHEFLDKEIYQDPRAKDSILMQDIPRAVGQIGTVALPAGVAGGAGKLASMAAAGLIGGSQAGEDAARQVHEKNEKAGAKEDSNEELIKGLINFGMGGAIDAILGAGSLGRFLAEKGGEGLVKGAAKQGLKGAVGEGLQQTGQDLLVEGKVDPEKSLRAVLVGGVVQGGAALAGKGLQGKVEQPPVLETPTSTPETPTETLPVKEVLFSPDDIQAAVQSEEWNVPNPTPVDKAIQKAKRAKVMLTPERVQALAEAYDGTETSEAEVNKRLRSFYIQDRVNLGPKDADDAAARTMDNLPEEAQKVRKEIDATDAAIKNIQELKAKLNAATDMTAGDKWTMNGQYDAIIKQLEARRLRAHEKITSLMQPPRMEVDMRRDEHGRPMRMPVGQMHGPAIPGGEINPQSPVAPRFEGMDYRQWELPAPAQPAGLLPEQSLPHPGDPIQGPAIPLPDRDYGLRAIQRARGDTRRMNPALERLLMDYAAQEGEQRPPFAEQRLPVGTVETPPTPEPVSVVDEQVRLTADPNSSRAATLITPGEKMPAVPKGLQVADTKHGKVIFNPKKTNETAVYMHATGDVFEPEILGMSPQEQIKNLKGNQPKVVTASTPNAVDVQAEVVTTPEGEAAAKRAAKKAVPGGKVEVKPVEQVTDERKINSQSEDPLPPEDKVYHSGLPVNKTLKAIKDKYGIELNVPKAIVSVIHGVSQKLAKNDAAGALFKAKADELLSLKRKLANTQYEQWMKIKKEINDPRFVKWAHDGLDTGKRDYNLLPKELREVGRTYDKLLKEQHDIQRKYNIYVEEHRGGRQHFRPAEDVEGHALVSIDNDVFKAMDKGGKEWEKYEDAWLRQWKKTKSPKNPGWEAEARKALNEFMQPLAGGRFEGGEPLFNAVRKAHGVPLPPEFRSKDLYGSAIKYIDRWSTDIAWGHVVQNNPVLRRYFGIQQDTTGKFTGDSDPLTFKGMEGELELARREGKKVGADWDEGQDGGEIRIHPLSDKSAKQSIIASYTGRPLGGSMGGDKALENANTLAGAMIMQTKTGIRDFAQSIGDAFVYTNLKDGAAAVRGLIEAISNPAEGIREAKRAGAITDKPISVESAGVVSGAIYNAAHGLRSITGKNFLEEFGKSIAWHVFKEVALHQHKKGSPDLIEEFGPNDSKMSPEEKAEAAANTLLQQIQPDMSFRNLPDVLIPQNRRFLGALTGLMRWSVAKYNTWHENVWTPFTQGRPERLIKSVLLGSVFAGLTQEFLTWLSGTKPANVTFREWMNLPEGKKLEEFAPMFFAYHQAQGTFGILGDIALQGANVATGKPIARPELNPQMPAAIVGVDLLNTLYSFSKYSQEVGINPHDLGELGMEILRINQDIRMVDNMVNKDKRPDVRDEKMFEDIYGVSAKSGQPKVPSAYREYLRTPFSFGKELNRFETKEEFQRLVPGIKGRLEKGQQLPAIRHHVNDPSYYGYLQKMYGTDEAKRRLQRDQEEEAKSEGRRIILNSLQGK